MATDGVENVVQNTDAGTAAPGNHVGYSGPAILVWVIALHTVIYSRKTQMERIFFRILVNRKQKKVKNSLKILLSSEMTDPKLRITERAYKLVLKPCIFNEEIIEGIFDEADLRAQAFTAAAVVSTDRIQFPMNDAHANRTASR